MPVTRIPTPAAHLVDDARRVTVPWFQFFMGLYKALGPGGAGLGAPTDAGFILGTADPSLPNARVATDSLTVHVDLTAAGAIRWHVGGYFALITNGDPLSPEPLYDAEGDAVMGFVPTPEVS